MHPIRTLAKACFDRFRASRGYDLNSDTPHADTHARGLAITGFPFAARDAERAGNTALAAEIRATLATLPRGPGAYRWLTALAVHGPDTRAADVPMANAAE